MATGSWPTLSDVLSRIDGAKKQMFIAEMLSQSLAITEDMPLKEGTEIFGHEFAYRTSMPAGNWRQLNQGVGYSKSTTGKARVGMGSLEGYSQIDRMLAEANPAGIQAFRETEDVAFIEGMGQTWEETIFYGNQTTNPAAFNGLSVLYNTLTQTTAQNAVNVLNGGGVGSSNASMWLCAWGMRTAYGVYPRNSAAGLQSMDKADTVPAYDSAGNRYEAFTTWFRQQGGLAVEDWRNVVRLANLDVTNAGLAGPNAPDLFLLLSQMVMLPPALGKGVSGIMRTDAPNDAVPSVRPAIYCNRTVRFWLDAQGMRNRTVLQTINDAAGRVQDVFRGIPIRISDRLLITETAVS